MTGNISKEKRDKLLSKIADIKKFMHNNNADPSFLGYLNELQNEISSKKYGLVYEEHREEIDEILDNNEPIFVEQEKYLIPSGKVNFLLEGDNLASLRLLEKTHKEKFDVIYIDPPYNTGNNDFTYNDKNVDSSDSYKHSKWISFMNQRIKIAYNLLAKDGVMFISIDDNEQSHLKMLCDEIFGENLVEQYIWCLQDKSEGSFVKTAGLTVRKEHEYIIACFKNIGKKFKRYPGTRDFSEGSFSNPDNDPRGPWFSGNISRNGITSTTGSKYYTITNPAGENFTRNWTLSREEYQEALKDNRIFFAKGGAGVPRLKIFANEPIEIIQSSLFNDVHTSITGKNELKKLFDGVSPFSFPKPPSLIERLIRISSSNNALVLDFFAGSGTTAQAVMQLNKEDGGNRQFILCTNNENDICEKITFERIKRVIERENFQEGLKYFKIDYVDKKDKVYYEYADELINHITELVELENAIDFRNNKAIDIALTDEKLDEILSNEKTLKDIKKIYLGHDILMSQEQAMILNKNNIEYVIIPNYYYSEK